MAFKKYVIRSHNLISMILTCPLNKYVIRLHNLISMNIFFFIKDRSCLIIVKRNPKTNRLKNLLKTLTLTQTFSSQ